MNFYPIFTPIGIPSGGSLGWKGMMLYIGFMFGMLAELIGLGAFGLSNPFGVDILFEHPIFFVLHFAIGFIVGVIVVIRTCKDEIDEEYNLKKYGEKSN